MENITRWNVSPAIKRFIKNKESYLGRTCRKIWIYENANGEKYMFANFCKNYDKVIVTIAHYNENICRWLPSR